jgi:hypothetical protein
MSPAPDPIDQLLDEERGKLATAERQAHDARIAITTLEKAKAALSKQPDPSTPTLFPNQPLNAAERPQAHAGNGRATHRRRRSISASWKQVLRKMDQRGESNYDAILAYCSEVGIEIGRRSLRSQMSGYVNRHHFLVSPREGVFQLTPEGRVAAGIPGGGNASTNRAEAP